MTLADLTNAVQTKTIDRSTQEVLQTAGSQVDQDGFCYPGGEGFDIRPSTSK